MRPLICQSEFPGGRLDRDADIAPGMAATVPASPREIMCRRRLGPRLPRLVACLLLLLASGCDLPQDPEESFRSARAGQLRVGAAINPPFVDQLSPTPEGIEVEIIERFASEYQLEVEFRSGTESDLIRQLSEGALDLVIGGFNRKTVWAKHAALTRPYDHRHVLLVRKGENRMLFNLEASFSGADRQ